MKEKKYIVTDENGNTLRIFYNKNSPESWARFLLPTERLICNGKIYGRLTWLPEGYFKKRKKKKQFKS